MILSHIVAASENRVIGRDGGLPWHLPEDMRFFMTTTRGHIVIMGRKTFETLKKPLPGRLNIVITRRGDYKVEAGVMVAPDLKSALSKASAQSGDWPGEVFIAGGGEIYRESLPLVDRILLTEVHKTIEGDTTYPQLPVGMFREVSREHREGPVPYSFVTLERIAPSRPISGG